MVRSWLAALLLFAATPAFAGQSTEALRTELEQKVASNAWPAADRAYTELAGQARPTPRDHRLGGQAARAMGHVNDAAARLALGAKGGDEEAQAILDELERRFGRAKLKVVGDGSTVSLKPVSPLIDSEYRLVLERAKRLLVTHGKYDGLLPLGGFTLGDQAFTVAEDGVAKATLKR